MTSEEVTEAFEKTGWAIREVSSGEVVGEAGRYAIRPDEKVLGDETVFELRDEELDMKAYARRVPTPERAAALLNEYGVPAGISDVTPGKVPMVPPEAEAGSWKVECSAGTLPASGLENHHSGAFCVALPEEEAYPRSGPGYPYYCRLELDPEAVAKYSGGRNPLDAWEPPAARGS